MGTFTRVFGTLTIVAALVGCYDGGQYGYARHYIPLDEEEAFHDRAQEAVYNEVRTDPEQFQGVLVSWFGVVENVNDAENGSTDVRMSFRTHQERHLCSEEERETCRVTVSQASSGSFTGRVQLRGDDAQGRNRVTTGSLLRVYCGVTGDYDDEGGPLLTCEHYRHWPRGQWAHTGMRNIMRR